MKMIKPMLCADGDVSHFDKPGYIMQEKFDGTLFIILKKGNAVSMIGRIQKNDYSSNYP